MMSFSRLLENLCEQGITVLLERCLLQICYTSISTSESSAVSEDDDCFLNVSALSDALCKLVADADEAFSSSDDNDEDYWGEESDSECDMDMTQEENAAIEFEISEVFDDESNDDDIGKQPSKEPVVVSVSTQTEDPVVQAQEG
ncbi:unnamed protein product [Porites lobata]|uniref:Uncharacterized protein n=1 Tax=Porites lobata TaxID=104759 RepID=A0ABN8R307_9CNID|nr:unnamed protein product [Porites lobata]